MTTTLNAGFYLFRIPYLAFCNFDSRHTKKVFLTIVLFLLWIEGAQHALDEIPSKSTFNNNNKFTIDLKNMNKEKGAFQTQKRTKNKEKKFNFNHDNQFNDLHRKKWRFQEFIQSIDCYHIYSENVQPFFPSIEYINNHNSYWIHFYDQLLQPNQLYNCGLTLCKYKYAMHCAKNTKEVNSYTSMPNVWRFCLQCYLNICTIVFSFKVFATIPTVTEQFVFSPVISIFIFLCASALRHVELVFLLFCQCSIKNQFLSHICSFSFTIVFVTIWPNILFNNHIVGDEIIETNEIFYLAKCPFEMFNTKHFYGVATS